MVALTRVKIKDENGQEMVIWMETAELVSSEGGRRDETTRGSRDDTTRGDSAPEKALQQFVNLQNTIKTFASYSLNSFREIANANVDKVTLKFGINVGGEAGIPYITKGTVGSNLEITVECSFKS